MDMLFKQDFKKLYVRVVLLGATFVTLIVFGFWLNAIKFEFQDLVFLALLGLFLLSWLLSWSWDYLEIKNDELVRHTLGWTTHIRIQDISVLSYEDNPARPILFVFYDEQGKGRRQMSVTTGTWNANTLFSLNQEISRINPSVKVVFDKRSQKRFEKDKGYHLNHPKSIFGWVILGLRQVAAGAALGVILVMLRKL